MPRYALPLLLVVTCLSTSCAVGPAITPGSTRSMPAARAALAPEYRIFYDTLFEYGDWVLIEPHGYLFHPRVDFHTWRPYESGFWAPSDSYGWVWISSESFGWATYHYGRWFYDELRGWVWKPGSQWGPAWVNWQANDRYVGWSPLSPGAPGAPTPGGSYVFAAVDQMGTPDLKLFRAGELGEAVSDARPANNPAVVDGVEIPLGPSIERIERLRGRPLPRVRIADVIRDRAGESPGSSAIQNPSAPADEPSITLEEARRAGEEVARAARSLRAGRGALPERIGVIKPVGLPIRPRTATADSARIRVGR